LLASKSKLLIINNAFIIMSSTINF
jgi:hypothetical protein